MKAFALLSPILQSINRLSKRQMLFCVAGIYSIAIFMYIVCLYTPPIQYTDSLQYIETAKQFFGAAKEIPFRPVLFPLYLAATDSIPDPGFIYILVSLVLHFVCAMLLSYIVYDSTGKIVLALITAVVLASPHIAGISFVVMPENLTSALLCAAFYFLYIHEKTGRNRNLAVSSVLIGLSAVSHPSFVLCIAALSGMYALRIFTRRLPSPWMYIRKYAIFLLLPGILILASYSIYNYSRYRFFGISYMSGITLASRTVRIIDDLPPSEMKDILIKTRNAEIVSGHSHTALSYIYQAMPELKTRFHLSDAECSQMLVAPNLRLIASHPMEYLEEVFGSMFRFWLPVRAVHGFPQRVFVLAAAFMLIFFNTLFFASVIVTAILSVAFRRMNMTTFLATPRGELLRSLLFILATLILYTCVVTSLAGNGEQRYRANVDPLIVVAAIIGGFIVYSIFKQRQDAPGRIAIDIYATVGIDANEAEEDPKEPVAGP